MLISSCFKPVPDYIEQETLSIQENMDRGLSALGYSDYDVIIIPHFSYGRNKIEEDVNYISFKGSDFEPDEGVVPPQYKKLDPLTGSYRTFNSKSKYSLNSDKKSVNLDYVSVLLVFNKIENNQIENLYEILMLSVMNFKRGDQLLIRSK